MTGTRQFLEPMGVISYAEIVAEGFDASSLSANSSANKLIKHYGGFNARVEPLERWIEDPDNIPAGATREQYLEVIENLKKHMKAREALSPNQPHLLPDIYILKSPTLSRPIESGNRLPIETGEFLLDLADKTGQLNETFFEKFIPDDVQARLKQDPNPNALVEHKEMLRARISQTYFGAGQAVLALPRTAVALDNSILYTNENKQAVLIGEKRFSVFSVKELAFTLAHEVGHVNANLSREELEAQMKAAGKAVKTGDVEVDSLLKTTNECRADFYVPASWRLTDITWLPRTQAKAYQDVDPEVMNAYRYIRQEAKEKTVHPSVAVRAEIGQPQPSVRATGEPSFAHLDALLKEHDIRKLPLFRMDCKIAQEDVDRLLPDLPKAVEKTSPSR